MARDYGKEYSNYHSKPAQKKRRASRNAARRSMKKAGRVSKGDGKEVDHRNGNAMDNRPRNLSVMSRVANRRKG